MRAGLVLACWVAVLAAGAARAQVGYDADEVRDLRVRHVAVAGDVQLSWQDPATPPEDHVVRRCTLAALRGGAFGAPYFGNCVAEGVPGTEWSEAVPEGAVFYLVSGRTGGVEASLGSSWNGRSAVPRPPTDCANPPSPQPVVLVLSLEATQLVCGSEVHVYFPVEDLTFVVGNCTGLQSGFLGVSNGLVPGRVIHACASATGTFGSGEIMRLEFARGECPVGLSAFRVARCRVLPGDPDCGTVAWSEQTCLLDLQ